MKRKEKIVREILEYIEKNLENDGGLSLESLELRLGYSRFYLNRTFRGETGATIHRYIRERRLTEAARKLVKTDKAIVDISCEAGYQSQQAFTLAFKQAYGDTPQIYRKKDCFRSLREQLFLSRIRVGLKITEWNAQLPESNFQTRAGVKAGLYTGLQESGRQRVNSWRCAA